MTSSPKAPSLPHAIDMEKAVLGALLLDGDSHERVNNLIDETSFFRPAHGAIYAAICQLRLQGDPVDFASVTEELRRESMLAEVGGALYLTELVDAMPSAANIEHYAQVVREKALLRKVVLIGDTASAEAKKPSARAADVAANLLRNVQAIQTSSVRSGMVFMDELVTRTYSSLDRRQTGDPAQTIRTGFNDLDDFVVEFEPGQLYVLAARPSQGKTALALNISKLQAANGKRVFVQSLEMSIEQLGERLTADATNIPMNRLRRKDELWEIERSRIASTLTDLGRLPIIYDDRPGTIEKVCGVFQYAVREHKAQLLILDHLALIQRGKGMKSYEHITQCSNQLKAMAKDLNVPLLCLAQLNRVTEARDTHPRPQLGELRDSGAVEQDADMVLLLWRPEWYMRRLKDSDKTVQINGTPMPVNGLAEVIVAKNRQGQTGSCWLRFQGEYQRFSSLNHLNRPLPSVDMVSNSTIATEDEDLPF